MDHHAPYLENWHAWMDARTWDAWLRALTAEAEQRGLGREVDWAAPDWKIAFEEGLMPFEALDDRFGAKDKTQR